MVRIITGCIAHQAFNHLYEEFIMTPEQLEQQSKDAVIAYLQDDTVKLDWVSKGMQHYSWSTKSAYLVFDFDSYYRISRLKTWYRVAEYKSGETVTACGRWNNENEIEKHEHFSKWLTERIEYDTI